MRSSNTRNRPEGSACIQNIQRQASCPSHSGSVEAPAARANRKLLRKAQNSPLMIAICCTVARRPR